MQKLLKLLKNPNIVKYGVAAFLLVVPLYPKFPLFNVPGTYVAIRAEDFLIAFVSLFWLIQVWHTERHDFFKDDLNKTIVMFWLVGFLSLTGGLLLTQSITLHLGFLHWARRIEYMLPFFIAVWALRKRGNSRFYGEVIFIASLMAFFYGLGQVYAQFPVISTQNEEFAKGLALRFVPGSRLHSTFAGHYDLAAFLVFVFPLAFAFLFAAKNWMYRIAILGGVMAPSFWLLMRTESRVSFLAYLLAVTVTLWLIRRRLFIVPFIAASIILMATVGGLGDRYLYTINIYKQKVLNMKDKFINLSPAIVWAQEKSLSAPVRLGSESAEGKITEPVIEDRSTAIRLKVEWPRAIRAFFKNPLLGTGYSSIGLAVDNDYLRLLAEVGLAGFLAFTVVIIRIMAELGKVLRRVKMLDFDNAFAAGFLGGLVGLLLNATFIDVFEASKVAIVFWTLAGVAVGVVVKKDA